MNALIITTASVAVYVGGWFLTAVAGTRWLLSKHCICHRESRSGAGHKWSNEGHCREFCRPGCWRPVGEPTATNVTQASIAALLWPLVVVVAAVWVAASGKPAHMSSASRIAELERELGINQ